MKISNQYEKIVLLWIICPMRPTLEWTRFPISDMSGCETVLVVVTYKESSTWTCSEQIKLEAFIYFSIALKFQLKRHHWEHIHDLSKMGAAPAGGTKPPLPTMMSLSLEGVTALKPWTISQNDRARNYFTDSRQNFWNNSETVAKACSVLHEKDQIYTSSIHQPTGKAIHQKKGKCYTL